MRGLKHLSSDQLVVQFVYCMGKDSGGNHSTPFVALSIPQTRYRWRSRSRKTIVFLSASGSEHLEVGLDLHLVLGKIPLSLLWPCAKELG